MHVAFQGATWDLNKDVTDKIAHYSGILEDIPELNTFMCGLLLSDIRTAVKSYFWCYILIWPLLQLGTSMAMIFSAILIYVIPTLVKERTNYQREVKKHTVEMRNALILFFTSHRLKVYGSVGKMFIVIVISFILLTVLPTWLLPLVITIVISSLLIQTETYVNQMQIQ